MQKKVYVYVDNSILDLSHFFADFLLDGIIHYFSRYKCQEGRKLLQLGQVFTFESLFNLDQFLGTFTKKLCNRDIMSFRVNFQVNDIVRKLTESFTFNLYKKSVKKKKNAYHHTIFLGIGQIGTGCTVFILVSWTFDRKIIGLLHYNCL